MSWCIYTNAPAFFTILTVAISAFSLLSIQL